MAPRNRNRSLITRPVFIIGAPRSGTTLLFAILSASRELWSLYREGETIYRRYLHPESVGWSKGNRLLANDLTQGLRRSLTNDFYRRATNLQRWHPNLVSYASSSGSEGQPLHHRLLGVTARALKPRPIRLLEKTPKNSLRIPFLDALFPDAQFVYLTREGRANVSSLLEGWRTGGRFRTYRLPVELDIAEYPRGERWTFALPPGWQRLTAGHTLPEICAFQYVACNETALEDLSSLPARRVTRLRYEDLVAEPRRAIESLCSFLEIGFHGALRRLAESPPVVNALSPPAAEKWLRNSREIQAILPRIRPTMERLGYPLA